MKRKLLVVIAACCSLLLLSGGVNALPEYEVHDYYYTSDDGVTYTEVGEYDIYCNGAHDTWGDTTAPYIYETMTSCNLEGYYSGCFRIDPVTHHRSSVPCWF